MSAHHRRRYRLMPRPGLNRRGFLRRMGGATLGLMGASALAGCGGGNAGSGTPPSASKLMFRHGVASGDPRTDRVILWTRVTPEVPTAAVAVEWRLARDPELSDEVQSGRFVTGPERDFTVKVDPAGLASFTTYYYVFAVTQPDGEVLRSPVGRTKTAPSATDDVSRVRAAVASCSNYAFGFFSAYGHIGERADLDLVIHLGDYLYETGGGQVRQHVPNREIISLADYRERHAQYKTDPDLQEAHRQHPWITTWDDHESTDNSYRTGANNHTEGPEGCWEERMGWAIRAYFEWMPIRDNGPGFDAPIEGPGQTCPRTGELGLLPEGLGRIYRTIPYGSLIDFIMLDTRHAGRAEQNGIDIVSEEQTILGAEQREWFLQELPSRTATWKIVGNGVTFAPLRVPVNPIEGCANPLQPVGAGTDCFLNEDAWDGYRFDRDLVFDALEQNNIQNVVMIFGDIHAVIAQDLPRDGSDPLGYNPLTGEGSFGVELCCGGIAQVPLPVWDAIRPFNPHMKHVNEVQNGYLLMDITPERVQGEWYYAAVQVPNAQEVPDPVMLQTAVNSQRLTPAPTRTSAKPNSPPLAP